MGCAKVRISTLSIETIEQGNVEMFVVTAGRVRARYFHDREKIKIVGPPLEMARRRGITLHVFLIQNPHREELFQQSTHLRPPPTPEIERETVFDFELLERCLVE